MENHDYNNWLISLEADNFSSYIKAWFAYLATVHEIVLKTINEAEREQLVKEMRGDGDFLKRYKESHFPSISISDSTKSSIIECYRISKTCIKETYPEYFFITYYKQIGKNKLYKDEPAEIAGNMFTFNMKVEKNSLYIGILMNDAAPIIRCIKNKYIEIKISLLPNIDDLNILEEEDIFYRYLLNKSNSIYKNITLGEDNEDYITIKGLLSHILQFIINKARHELDLYLFIYREKFRDSPTENEAKEWFYEFSYSLRNVLFHRVIDPFDKDWSKIVKYASQALYDIVALNIEILKTK